MKINLKLSCCRVALGLLLSVACVLVGQPAQAQFIQHRSVQPTPEEQEALRDSYLEARAASASLHAGRYAQAETEARQSLSFRPNCGLGDEVLAAALDAQDKEQEALQAYQTVVEHRDRSPRNVLPYALLLLKSGQWARAVAAYNAALPLLAAGEVIRANSHFSPGLTEPTALAVAIHISRGLTYEAADDWAGESQHKEMMAEFGKALQLAPDSDLANYHYGYGWRSLGPKERAKMGSEQQAKASLQKAILLGKANVKKAAEKVLKDLNKPA